MIWLVGAFLVSAMASLWIIRYDHLHAHITADNITQGPQKFHPHPVPRIGGVAIVLGLIASGIAMLFLANESYTHEYWLLLLCAIPAFLSGVLEDLTKKVGVMMRLIATVISAALGAVLLHALISRLGIPFIDSLLATSVYVSMLVTVIAVGGSAHAINIIDGYNGLASIVTILILGSLAYVSSCVGDTFILHTSLILIGAIMGVLIWNYPNGLILLGDGGAYLLGFMIGELLVLLISRHSEVSPWFPMLLVTYPVWETIFSIYRRRFLRGTPPGLPDAMHLHTLIYRRLVRWLVGSQEAKHKLRRNAMTSPYLWGITLTTVIPAMLFWQNTLALVFFVFAFIFFYTWMYRRIVRFKSPRCLVIQYSRETND